MSAAQRLLERLNGVRQAGQSRWVARCPGHEDRSPSLSIRELEDGRVLLHDFGGCDTSNVLAALGLEVADLFERPLEHFKPAARDRGHYHAIRAALESLRDEVRVVVVVASDCSAGRPISETDADRLAVAAGRITSMVEVLYGR